MDNALRLQYLQAMGIDVWVPRASRVSDLTLVHELQDEIATPKLVEAQAQVIDIESCALCDSQTQELSGIGNQQKEWLFFVEVVNSDDDGPALEGAPSKHPHRWGSMRHRPAVPEPWNEQAGQRRQQQQQELLR